MFCFVFEGAGKMDSKDQKCQVYVARIGRIPNKEVISFFEQYGEIKKVHFPRQRLANGKSFRKSFCFITYVDAQSATKALGATDMKIRENNIDVQEARPRANKPVRKQTAPKAKRTNTNNKNVEREEVDNKKSVILAGVPADTDIRSIINNLPAIPLRYCSIIRSRKTKGTYDAVMKFYDEKDADKVVGKTYKIGEGEIEAKYDTYLRVKKD